MSPISQTYEQSSNVLINLHSVSSTSIIAGYDVNSWVPREDRDVIAQGTAYQMAKSAAEQQELAKQTGVKYSPLQTLDYFSPVKDTVIDPMHNLFLGIAKTVLHTWKENKLLTDGQCRTIQGIVNSVRAPRDIGRIPVKVASGFSSLTADEWRLWTLLYSSIALEEVLPQEHRFCWDLFVHACAAFCSKAITGSLCDYGRECMVSFCTMFQDLYGKAACVPNMHFSCHLDQYLRDHGPAYGFWLFPFERMNGLLGHTYTNKHDIAPQFMRHFMNKCTTLDLVHDLPDDLHTAFFPNGLTSAAKRTSGGVHHSSDIVEVTRARLPLQLGSAEGNILDLVTSQKISQAIIDPKPVYLSSSCIQCIQKLLSLLANTVQGTIEVERCAQTAIKSTCGESLYVASSSTQGDTIYGRRWNSNGRQLETSAGSVQQFLKVNFNIKGKHTSLIVAEVAWYSFHNNASVPFPWQEVTPPRASPQRVTTAIPYLPVACILSRAATLTRLGRDLVAPVDFCVHDSILNHFM